MRYRLAAPADAALAGRWAVQWNLALSAGDAPGRYLTLPGPAVAREHRPGRPTSPRVALVDEWLGLEAHLAWSPAAELAWAPVETVSVSEGGFERHLSRHRVAAGLAAGGRSTQEISMTLTMVAAMILDDLGAIERVDQHDTRRVLAEFPEQCRRALRAAAGADAARPHVRDSSWWRVWAAPRPGGDLVATCAAETLDVPILVHRGYGLPAAAGPRRARVALVVLRRHRRGAVGRGGRARSARRRWSRSRRAERWARWRRRAGCRA